MTKLQPNIVCNRKVLFPVFFGSWLLTCVFGQGWMPCSFAWPLVLPCRVILQCWISVSLPILGLAPFHFFIVSSPTIIPALCSTSYWNGNEVVGWCGFWIGVCEHEIKLVCVVKGCYMCMSMCLNYVGFLTVKTALWWDINECIVLSYHFTESY